MGEHVWGAESYAPPAVIVSGSFQVEHSMAPAICRRQV